MFIKRFSRELTTTCGTPMRLGCNSERAAAKLLGHSQDSWDRSVAKKPESKDKHWDDLTADEKSGAVALGFIKLTWDNKSGKEQQPASESKHWAELTTCDESTCKDELAAAKVLGYTQVNWDNIKVVQPVFRSLFFDKLTHEQRMAAVVLGYTSITWDNVSSKEQQPASEDKFWAELNTCGECSPTTWCARHLRLFLHFVPLSIYLTKPLVDGQTPKSLPSN